MFFLSYFNSLPRPSQLFRPFRYAVRMRDQAFSNVSRMFQTPRLLLNYITPLTITNWVSDQNIALRERETAHQVETRALRSRIEGLEAELAEANNTLALAEIEKRELHQCFAHQSHQIDLERESHARGMDKLHAELAGVRADLTRADGEQEAAVRLLEGVEAELKQATELAQSLSAKASSLEVKYEEKKLVLSDLERANAALTAEVEQKENARIAAAGNAKELGERLAYAEAYSLELQQEKNEMAAKLEQALQLVQQQEETMAEQTRRLSQGSGSKLFARSSIVSWLARTQ